MSVQTWVSILLSIVVLKVVFSIIKAYRLRKIMPPGPPGLPLLGNAFDTGAFQWLQFTLWKERYGPIFSLNLAGQPTVVLNDFTTTGDLLDRRSNVYSSRPRFIMASEILTGSLSIGMLPYGNMWRRMRRAAHEGFSGHTSVAYQPLQEKESAILALRMLEDPEDWDNHLRRSAASTMLCAVHGWLSLDRSADLLVKRINDFMHRAMYACLPGHYLVEIFPSMLHLPDWMAKWKREGREWFEQDTKMFQGLLDDVKTKMKLGTSEPCFAEMLIENEKKYDLSGTETAWLTGSVFGAGAETTAAALAVFVLAMVLYPDVMHRAQAQVDRVVGRERLPNFSDREKLPYIEAMVKEILRWRTVGPLGLPRYSTQDDWYKGYFIPKGTLVLVNVWAINRDPTYFPDYGEIRPERYLDASGQLSDTVPDTHGLGHMTFGTGRRICPGKDVANQTLFMDMATMLWAFNIGKAVDTTNGQLVTPSRTDFVDEGVVARPVPFRCSITPRSPEVASLIHSLTDTYTMVKSK